MTTPVVHWTLTIHDNPVLRFWSGQGNLTLDGDQYFGALINSTQALVALTPVADGVNPSDRLSVQMATTNDIRRRMFADDLGPLRCEVNLIHSTDGGATYTKLPRSRVGRMSNVSLVDSYLSFEIETISGDVDRGRPLMWSDASQQARYPGDRGFRFMADLASGIEVKWPN